MRRTMLASEIAGIRALAVHAKDDKARALHLYLLMKDLRKAAT